MNALLLWAALAIAPAQCVCWHARRLRHWPGITRPVSSATAMYLCFALVALSATLAWFGSHSIALGIVLPLSALAVAGIVHVSLAARWPRCALGLSSAGIAIALTLLGWASVQ